MDGASDGAADNDWLGHTASTRTGTLTDAVINFEFDYIV
jgi:hypothetical protein